MYEHGKINEIASEHNDVIEMLQIGINSLTKYIAVSGNNNDNSLEDLNLRLCILLLDLQVGIKHLRISLISKNQFEANYFARILSLNCFELMNSIYAGINKGINNFKKPEELIILEELKKKKKELDIIKTLHNQKLKEIRINLIAHRNELSGSTQNERMLKIDVQEIGKIAMSISDIYVAILECLGEIRQLP